MTETRRARPPGRLALTVFGVPALIGSIGCSPPDPTLDDSPVDERQSDLQNGTQTTDTNRVGYVSISNTNVRCSGIAIAPNWVLTAGHCFIDVNSAAPLPPFRAIAYIDRNTSTPYYSSYVVTDPYWYDLGSGAFPHDSGYDTALMRLDTPLPPPYGVNSLVVAPEAVTVGEQLECHGYGCTQPGVNGGKCSGGGVGQHQKATLAVTSTTARPNDLIKGQAGTDMIEVTKNSAGQIALEGDSGGACSPVGSPHQIVGTMDLSNGTVTDLVRSSSLHYWTEPQMWTYANPTDRPSGLAASAPLVPEVASGHMTYSTSPIKFIVASSPTTSGGDGSIWMKSFTASTGWSAWNRVATTGLPSGRARSRVAIALRFQQGLPGQAVALAVVDDSNRGIYVSIVQQPNSPPWHAVNWTRVGSGTFQSGPAITFGRSGRLDAFGFGDDHKLYGAWASSSLAAWSGWGVISDDGGTFTADPSAAYTRSSEIAVVGLDSTAYGGGVYGPVWLATLSGASTTSYGTWGGWQSLGGGFLQGPGIASWELNESDVSWGTNHVDVVGVGTDGDMYHITSDSGVQGPFGGWVKLWMGSFGSQASVASNNLDTLDLAAAAGGTPYFAYFPW